MAYIIAVFPELNDAVHALNEFGDVKDLDIVRSVMLYKNDLGTFLCGHPANSRPRIVPADLQIEIGQYALVAEIHERYPATSAMIVHAHNGTLSRLGDESDLAEFFAVVPRFEPSQPPPAVPLTAKRQPDNPVASRMPVTTAMNAIPRFYGNPLVVGPILFAAIGAVIFVILKSTH